MKTKLVSSFRLLMATLFMVFATNLFPLASAFAATNTNSSDYWEGQGYGTCVKYDDLTGKTFTVPTAPTGDEYTLAVVKAGSDQSTDSANELDTTVAAGDVLSHTSGKDLSHVILCYKETPPVQVTAAEVTFVDDCGTANDTYTVPVTPHVTYSASAGEHTGSGIVTVTASADPGYELTAPYTFEHLFTDVACPVEDTPVTPEAPISQDLTCNNNGFYNIPEVEGVQYQVEGVNVDAGHYTVSAAGTVHVTAVALTGYTLTGTASWDLTFTAPNDCEQPQPQKVTICHRTNSVTNPYVKESVSASSVDGNTGNDNGQGDHLAEHTGPVWDANTNYPTPHNGDQWGDIIPTIEGVTPGLNWSGAGMAIYNNNCNPITLKVVQAEAPVFVQATCNSKGTYTIPEVEGVQYKVNGVVTTAGTYQATTGTSVTVTAEATEGFVLKEGSESSWNFDFDIQGGCVLGDNDVCPNLVGTQSTVPNGYTKNSQGNCVKPAGHVLGASTVLPNTGSSALFNVVSGLALITLAIGARLAGRQQIKQS